MDPLSWQTPSDTQEGVAYTVRLLPDQDQWQWQCSCPHWRTHHTDNPQFVCKHVVRLKEILLNRMIGAYYAGLFKEQGHRDRIQRASDPEAQQQQVSRPTQAIDLLLSDM